MRQPREEERSQAKTESDKKSILNIFKMPKDMDSSGAYVCLVCFLSSNSTNKVIIIYL